MGGCFKRGCIVRLNTLVTLGISGTFGILAIFLARGWINGAVNDQYAQSRPAVKIRPVKKIKTVPVLVADTGLQFGDRLTPQNVRVADYLVSAVPEGSFTNFDELFVDPDNQPLVLTQIAANEPLLAFKLSGAGGRAILSTKITENMRAVSIRVNDVSGVAGFVQPSDKVDIFLTEEIDVYIPRKMSPTSRKTLEQAKSNNFKTSLLLQNVKVLGANQTYHTIEGKAKVVKTITLEVSLQQAQKLALAKRVGELSLTLRHAGSTEAVTATTLNVSDLTRSKPKKSNRWARTKAITTPATAKPAVSGAASVTVIRGGEYDQVRVFKDETPEAQMAGGSL